MSLSSVHGAGDRTRTGTLSPAVDFESTTSTNSITPADAVPQDSFYIIADGGMFGKKNFASARSFLPRYMEQPNTFSSCGTGVLC